MLRWMPACVSIVLLAAMMPTAAADPLSGLVDDRPSVCYNLENLAPDEGTAAECVSGVLLGPDGGTPGGSCPPPWSGFGFYIERKANSTLLWTPLYGINSPLTGFGMVVQEQGEEKEMAIGYNFGADVKLSKTETTHSGVSLEASSGQTKVRYQFIEWSQYRMTYCPSGEYWEFWAPSDYRPTGAWKRETMDLNTKTPYTNWDNDYAPPEWENVIKIDLSYWEKEIEDCVMGGESYWFGSKTVYSTSVSFNFEATSGGQTVTEVFSGSTVTKSKSNKWFYEWTGPGCYYMDFLGDGQDSGLAFHKLPNGTKPSGTGECEEGSCCQGALENIHLASDCCEEGDDCCQPGFGGGECSSPCDWAFGGGQGDAPCNGEPCAADCIEFCDDCHVEPPLTEPCGSILSCGPVVPPACERVCPNPPPIDPCLVFDTSGTPGIPLLCDGGVKPCNGFLDCPGAPPRPPAPTGHPPRPHPTLGPTPDPCAKERVC